jgi:hypothetical protein
MTLKQTFEDEQNPCKVKDLAIIAQENLRFIIKNHRERMHFLQASISAETYKVTET